MLVWQQLFDELDGRNPFDFHLQQRIHVCGETSLNHKISHRLWSSVLQHATSCQRESHNIMLGITFFYLQNFHFSAGKAI